MVPVHVTAPHAAFARSLSAGRLALGLVGAMAAVTASSWRDPLPIDVVLLVIGIAILVSGREIFRWIRGRAGIPDPAMIVVDAALGVALLVTLGESAGVIGWVAMVVPVIEALVWLGAVAATLTWVALAGSFVVLSVMAGTDVQPVVMQLLRHIGGSVLIAIPGWAAGSVIGQEMTNAEEAKAAARDRAEALFLVGVAGRRISAAAESGEVLAATVEGAVAMGFEAADVSILRADGSIVEQKVAGVFEHGPPGPVEIVAVDDLGRVFDFDSAEQAQGLHRLGFAGGASLAVGLGDSQLVLRVWYYADGGGVTAADVMEILANQAAVAWGQATTRSDLTRKADGLRHDATHDALTGLANRSGLLEFLNHSVKSQRRDMALLFIDLDGFKAINDEMGHDAGDEVLRLAAGRICDSVGEGGFVGRLGGDEFVVAATAESVQEAAVTGNRIIVALEAPMSVDGGDARISGSVGVTFVDPKADLADILRDADRAMYAAKRAGGGRVAAIRR